MEVIKLENMGHYREDMIMPVDIFLLQVSIAPILFNLNHIIHAPFAFLYSKVLQKSYFFSFGRRKSFYHVLYVNLLLLIVFSSMTEILITLLRFCYDF